MSQLVWSAPGERVYEAGVDRGVLYVGSSKGVAWNGLISVSEESTGAEAKSYYLDGVKYLNRSSPEEFEATIEAYTYPEEFAQCDGSSEIKNGLYATQQIRIPFGLTYRSLIGNDTLGSSYAYKIHLVYEATAAPAAKSYSSLADTIDPFNFSWSLTTRPSRLIGRRPTSHFVVDSRKTPRDLLVQIEEILYGTTAAEPRLLPVDELVYMFDTWSLGVFDARVVGQPYYNIFDGGQPPSTIQTSTINGGVP